MVQEILNTEKVTHNAIENLLDTLIVHNKEIVDTLGILKGFYKKQKEKNDKGKNK
jgi:hypothetical protein